MLSQGLPVSRLVSVQIQLENQAAAVPVISSCCIVGTSGVIDTVERMRRYANISEIGADFATTSEEFLAAELWFSQSPRPNSLYLGRWAKTATQASLIGGQLLPGEYSMSNWVGITDGSLRIPITGFGGPPANFFDITGVDFSLATNMNGVAAIIDDKLSDAPTSAPCNCTWDGNRFIFQTSISGIPVDISYAQPVDPPTGTDISEMVRGTAARGARTVGAQAGETALEAVVILDNLFSSRFYCVIVPSATDADHLQIAAYCEAADPPHYYALTSMDPRCIDGTQALDIASELNAFGYNKTACQYSSTSNYAVCSFMARILTTNWLGSNTTITLMYKREPGVKSEEKLSTNQADVLQRKGCNVYTPYANDTEIIQYGTSVSRQFADTIIGADAIAAALQTAVFNVLFTSNTKVPQTDPGMGMLLNAASGVCSQFVTNGWLAPGTWNANGFGLLETGNLLPLGFYVYAQSMLTQNEAERAARRAPLMQIACKTAGAIHTADILVTVNP